MSRTPNDFDREFADIVGRLDIKAPRWPRAGSWAMTVVVAAIALGVMVICQTLAFPAQLLAAPVFLAAVLIMSRVYPRGSRAAHPENEDSASR